MATGGKTYSCQDNVTNTAGDSIFAFNSAVGIRPAIFDIIIGSSDSGADNAAEYHLQRMSGTIATGSDIAEVAFDEGDPTSLMTVMAPVTVEASVAGAVVLNLAINQRATFRWVAFPGKFINIGTGTGQYGRLIPNAIGGSAFGVSATVAWTE